jgi:hypothetical protein
VTKGFLWHVVFELIKQVYVFIRHLENCPPYFFAGGRDDDGEPAPPPGPPPSEPDRVIGQTALHQTLGLLGRAGQRMRLEISG